MQASLPVEFRLVAVLCVLLLPAAAALQSAQAEALALAQAADDPLGRAREALERGRLAAAHGDADAAAEALQEATDVLTGLVVVREPASSAGDADTGAAAEPPRTDAAHPLQHAANPQPPAAHPLPARELAAASSLCAELVQCATAGGKPELALRAARWLVDVYVATLGAGHPASAAARQELANVFASQQRFAEAIAQQRLVEAQLAASLSLDAPQLADARVRLAEWLTRLGELDAARVYLEQAAAVAASRGEPHALALQWTLVRLCARLGDVRSVVALVDAIAPPPRTALEPGSAAAQAEAVASLACSLGRPGLDAQCPLLDRACALLEAADASDDQRVQAARQRLVRTLAEAGRRDQAAALATRALEGLARTLGEQHPQLEVLRREVARLHGAQQATSGR